MALISIRSLTVKFNDPPLLDGISLQLEAGERLCLMGRNGTGKSTLMKLISGDVSPDGGEVIRQLGLRVALVSQEIPSDLSGTIADVVAGGIVGESGEGDEESWRHPVEVERILSRLSLNGQDAFETLSGGTKRRTLLARALVSTPDILLLDEPTNHLDIDTIGWLEEFLLKHVKTLMFVTHDRMFARKLANRVAEIDRGRLYSFSCGYDTFVSRRQELLEAETTNQALFERKLSQEEAWVRQGIKARRTRNEGRVRVLIAMREERRNQRDRIGTARIQLQEAERSGRRVIDVEGASFAYDNRPIIRNLTTSVIRGDRVGIIGPNGSGKTTLLRLFTGDLAPQEGTVKFGHRLEVLYFDQLREQLDLDRSVQENIAGGSDTVIINGQQRHIIGYLHDFLFTAERARSPVRILSGGERNRLLLARLFTRPSNVLIMDEPTNDLDAETLELLEELLLDYTGTLLLVSHDREFLNNVVTSTLVLTGNGEITEYAGGYDDWLQQSSTAQSEVIDSASKQTKKHATKPRIRAEKPAKLSFKDARELEALPARIEVLEKEQAELQQTLANPLFYKKEAAEAGQLKERLNQIEQELTTAYKRWEELESINAAG